VSVTNRGIPFTGANLPGSAAEAGPVVALAYDAPMIQRLTLRSTLVAAAAALLLAVAVAPTHAAPNAHAHAAATCDLSKDGRKLGATYVTSLSATKLGCAAAKKAVKAFNACRRAHGGAAGRCPSKVKGFSCRETRKAIPTEFSAKVRCSASGGRRLAFGYTQFT
jgi:hypothetical protein